MKVLIREKLSPHKFKTPEGYLICQDAILARTGKQTYRKNELFLDTDDDSEVEVDRPYDEVFAKETLASFENKPITIEHPDEDVTIDNYKDYSVGFARDIRQGKVDNEDVIIGNLVITDKDAIDKIESGEMVELSCGYDCDIVGDDNSPRQTHIRGNHIALCEQGRAGIAKIVDSKVKDEKGYVVLDPKTQDMIFVATKEQAIKKAKELSRKYNHIEIQIQNYDDKSDEGYASNSKIEYIADSVKDSVEKQDVWFKPHSWDEKYWYLDKAEDWCKQNENERGEFYWEQYPNRNRQGYYTIKEVRFTGTKEQLTKFYQQFPDFKSQVYKKGTPFWDNVKDGYTSSDLKEGTLIRTYQDFDKYVYNKIIRVGKNVMSYVISYYPEKDEIKESSILKSEPLNIVLNKLNSKTYKIVKSIGDSIEDAESERKILNEIDTEFKEAIEEGKEKIVDEPIEDTYSADDIETIIELEFYNNKLKTKNDIIRRLRELERKYDVKYYGDIFKVMNRHGYIISDCDEIKDAYISGSKRVKYGKPSSYKKTYFSVVSSDGENIHDYLSSLSEAKQKIRELKRFDKEEGIDEHYTIEQHFETDNEDYSVEVFKDSIKDKQKLYKVNGTYVAANSITDAVRKIRDNSKTVKLIPNDKVFKALENEAKLSYNCSIRLKQKTSQYYLVEISGPNEYVEQFIWDLDDSDELVK